MRLGEIAGALAWRERSRRRLDVASRSRDRLIEREHPREDAGDVAVDRRGLLPEGDRRDRGGGIGADAGQGASSASALGNRPPRRAISCAQAWRLRARE